MIQLFNRNAEVRPRVKKECIAYSIDFGFGGNKVTIQLKNRPVNIRQLVEVSK